MEFIILTFYVLAKARGRYVSFENGLKPIPIEYFLYDYDSLRATLYVPIKPIGIHLQKKADFSPLLFIFDIIFLRQKHDSCMSCPDQA